MRFLVLFFIAVCLLSVAKVALLRWKAQPPSTAQTSVWQADGSLRAYPTAKLSPYPNLVFSPYQEETLLDVTGHRPGNLMRCGASRRPFYVPLRNDLHYGDIVGEWIIQRADREGSTEYRVRFLGKLDGVSGHGRRVRSEGRVLSEEEQSSIRLTGHFEEDHLICHYEEQPPGQETERGLFRWVFNSAEDVLHGAVQAPRGLIDSQGKRTTGSRGQFPASGNSPESFVPQGWELVDSVTAPLATGGEGAKFLVLVVEEQGVQSLRWLVLAQQKVSHGDYQTTLITPHACLSHHGNGLGDPFHGLFLPHESPRGGIFGLRHRDARDDRHAGVDVWFQYDPETHDWRLSEGRRYRFDLAHPEHAPECFAIVPGESLASFDIHAVKFQAKFSPHRGREFTAKR